MTGLMDRNNIRFSWMRPMYGFFGDAIEREKREMRNIWYSSDEDNDGNELQCSSQENMINYNNMNRYKWLAKYKGCKRHLYNEMKVTIIEMWQILLK